jgi:hypothetical protein
MLQANKYVHHKTFWEWSKTALCGSLNFLRTTCVGSLNIPELADNSSLISLRKLQNQRTTGSSSFKNLKDPAVFMKGLAKNRWYLSLILRTAPTLA